jgi:hypothetical protein
MPEQPSSGFKRNYEHGTKNIFPVVGKGSQNLLFSLAEEHKSLHEQVFIDALFPEGSMD